MQNVEKLNKAIGFMAEAEQESLRGSWGGERIALLKAIELLKALLTESEAEAVTPAILSQAETKLKDCRSRLKVAEQHLAVAHKERGILESSYKNREAAIAAFEDAMRLTDAENLEQLEEIKILLDKEKILLRDSQMYRRLTPHVKRGEQLIEVGNYGEAIFELDTALDIARNLPDDHKFKLYVNELCDEAKMVVFKTYLDSIARSLEKNRYRAAHRQLEKAAFIKPSVLEEEEEQRYQQMQNTINERISNEEELEDDEARSGDWEAAVKDYEEALSLFSSYSAADPLMPAFQSSGNIYASQFVAAKERLARLYEERADGFEKKEQNKKAARNYREALRLLSKNSRLYKRVLKKYKKARASKNTD
ncbi:MAG: hypothetical protein GX221_05270 [Candidatus Riflebacteria bacterium]|nr:hypothetical protein [Candidatus Riflebacteria bacterium]